MADLLGSLWINPEFEYDNVVIGGNEFYLGDHISLRRNGNTKQIYLGSRNTIESREDGWLRLNQNGSYGSGIYTPGKLRVDNTVNLPNLPNYTGITSSINFVVADDSGNLKRVRPGDFTNVGSALGSGDVFQVSTGDADTHIFGDTVVIAKTCDMASSGTPASQVMIKTPDLNLPDTPANTGLARGVLTINPDTKSVGYSSIGLLQFYNTSTFTLNSTTDPLRTNALTESGELTTTHGLDDPLYTVESGKVMFNELGTYELSASMLARSNAADRTELGITIKNETSGEILVEDRQYAYRDGNQDEGSTQINSFFFDANARDEIAFYVYSFGTSCDIHAKRFRVSIKKLV
jgi:hypothetical protein